MEAVWLGCMEYRRALALQHSLVDQVADRQCGDTLLMLTHPHVYTFGRSGVQANLLVPEETLSAEGISVERVSRGGDVTYHGPGQLVGYPIVRLERPDVRRFLRCLESALIDVLGTFGISSVRVEGATGVWADGKKIASIGVGVRRWVTYHGFALNVATDLSYFRRIHLCGLKGREATSISEITGREVPVEEVRDRVAGSCARYIRGFS